MLKITRQDLINLLDTHLIVIDGEISPMYIPNLEDKADKFTITFNFNIKYE